MILYAETSAVLSWLLGEPEGRAARLVLEGAEFVATSALTLIECDRAFHRLVALGQVSDQCRVDLSHELEFVADGWVVLRITDDVVRRSRSSLGSEAIRSLDAIHVATALEVASLIPGVEMLSLDARVRSCARSLGLRVLPELVAE